MIFDQRLRTFSSPELPNVTRLVPFERHLHAIRWQFVRGMLVGIMISAAIGVPAFKYSNTRKPEALSRESGTALARPATLGQTEARKSTSETIGTSLSLTSSTIPPNSGPPVTQAAPVADRSSPNTQPTKKTLATLAQLWASFEAGDTKAAVALAERYMRGDGIPVNCEQARVLLLVASKENSADATKKLQDFEANGCPAP